MKVRSPGPMKYDGPAMESKKQEMVDSTRSGRDLPESLGHPKLRSTLTGLKALGRRNKSFSCSFGVGPRWPRAQLDVAVRTLKSFRS